MILSTSDESYSDKYKLMEDTLIKIGAGSDKGTEQKTYVMEPMMKVLLDNFMQAQEQMLLMAKGNVDSLIYVDVKFF